MNKKRWTDAEIALVTKHYSDKSNSAIAEMLSERTEEAVRSMGTKLGLAKSIEHMGEIQKMAVCRMHRKRGKYKKSADSRIRLEYPRPGVIITTHRLVG